MCWRVGAANAGPVCQIRFGRYSAGCEKPRKALELQCSELRARPYWILIDDSDGSGNTVSSAHPGLCHLPHWIPALSSELRQLGNWLFPGSLRRVMARSRYRPQLRP